MVLEKIGHDLHTAWKHMDGWTQTAIIGSNVVSWATDYLNLIVAGVSLAVMIYRLRIAQKKHEKHKKGE